MPALLIATLPRRFCYVCLRRQDAMLDDMRYAAMRRDVAMLITRRQLMFLRHAAADTRRAAAVDFATSSAIIRDTRHTPLYALARAQTPASCYTKRPIYQRYFFSRALLRLALSAYARYRRQRLSRLLLLQRTQCSAAH